MVNLGKLIQRLHESGLEFTIVGGIAAVLHGTSYVTYDLDICMEFTRENLKRLDSAIHDLHPFRSRDLPFVATEHLAADFNNLFLSTDCGELDCADEVAAIGSYEVVSHESEPVEFPFGQVQVLNMDALIQTKEARGAFQDQLVLPQLKALQERARQTKLISHGHSR